jgi:hypothetical protein
MIGVLVSYKFLTSPLYVGEGKASRPGHISFEEKSLAIKGPRACADAMAQRKFMLLLEIYLWSSRPFPIRYADLANMVPEFVKITQGRKYLILQCYNCHTVDCTEYF